MTEIDLRAKLSTAIEEVFPADSAALHELLPLEIDLSTIFEDLRDAAAGQGVVATVGTTNELRAILLTNPYIDYGSLTPVGPSLCLVSNNCPKKFCLGIDSDQDAAGGDGMRIRLLSWTGTWPNCEFEEDAGVASIHDFVDRLIKEIAVEAQATRAMAAIKEEQGSHTAEEIVSPGSTIFWDRTAAVLFLFSIIVSVSMTNSRSLVAGCGIAGALFMWTGLRNLKWASDTQGIAPRYSSGMLRIFVAALLLVAPPLNDVLHQDISIAPDCSIVHCSTF